MKNTKSILVISILLISLMFTACNKESEVSETTQSEEPITTEDSLDSTVADTTAEENIEDETDKAPAGSTSNTGVDSVGSNVTIEEGEYNEVKNQELQKQEEQQAAEQESTDTAKQETISGAANQQAQNQETSKGAALLAENNIDVSKYSSDTQEFLNEIIGMYDSGDFSEEDLMYMAKDAINAELNPSSGGIELSPESMAELRATSTDGRGTQMELGDIEYGTGDYTGLEDIRMN